MDYSAIGARVLHYFVGSTVESHLKTNAEVPSEIVGSAMQRRRKGRHSVPGVSTAGTK